MVNWEKEKRKAIAEESLKTRRAREKLKRQLEAFEKKVTPQALEKKSIEIHRWIARHASNRVVLKNKNISLFDGNQNAAKISQRVSNFAKDLKQEIQQSQELVGEDFWKTRQKKRVS